jgi:glucose uptake protein GlcU
MKNRLTKMVAGVLSGVFMTLCLVSISAAQVLPNDPYNNKLAKGIGGDNITVQTALLWFLVALLSVAGVIALIFIVLGGYRYVTSAGNEEQAEHAKHTITNAVIGLVVIILAYAILKVVENAITGAV